MLKMHKFRVGWKVTSVAHNILAIFARIILTIFEEKKNATPHKKKYIWHIIHTYICVFKFEHNFWHNENQKKAAP